MSRLTTEHIHTYMSRDGSANLGPGDDDRTTPHCPRRRVETSRRRHDPAHGSRRQVPGDGFATPEQCTASKSQQGSSPTSLRPRRVCRAWGSLGLLQIPLSIDPARDLRRREPLEGDEGWAKIERWSGRVLVRSGDVASCSDSKLGPGVLRHVPRPSGRETHWTRGRWTREAQRGEVLGEVPGGCRVMTMGVTIYFMPLAVRRPCLRRGYFSRGNNSMKHDEQQFDVAYDPRLKEGI